MDTYHQYDRIIEKCRSLFYQKTKDYGTAWRILRLSSLTDQLFIKAKRIRSIEEKGGQKVEDSVTSEYIGIINYCLLALIQMDLSEDEPLELPVDKVMHQYDEQVRTTIRLLKNKNHDYGEAWRDMRVSSMTDLILMKILRIKQIEDQQGKTLVSEGVDANYRDMINYAVFALIKMGEAE